MCSRFGCDDDIPLSTYLMYRDDRIRIIGNNLTNTNIAWSKAFITGSLHMHMHLMKLVNIKNPNNKKKTRNTKWTRRVCARPEQNPLSQLHRPYVKAPQLQWKLRENHQRRRKKNVLRKMNEIRISCSVNCKRARFLNSCLAFFGRCVCVCVSAQHSADLAIICEYMIHSYCVARWPRPALLLS